jgi:hypothetical protein
MTYVLRHFALMLCIQCFHAIKLEVRDSVSQVTHSDLAWGDQCTNLLIGASCLRRISGRPDQALVFLLNQTELASFQLRHRARQGQV